MHIPLRHGQVLVPSLFLNRLRRCSSHRQMRAETVTQAVNAAVDQTCATFCKESLEGLPCAA